MPVLHTIDLSKKLDDKKYESKLKKLTKKLIYLRLLSGGALSNTAPTPPILIIFEGWDASGKGGAIKRLTSKLDPRHFEVVTFAAPTETEKKEHFLTRFWRNIPRKGEFTVMDRSWYGRVLVERVESFATVNEWSRAYSEINDFEKTLVDSGVILIKFFMHISKEEQAKRFEERKNSALKQWKITDEDYRNAEKRGAYISAIEDMLERTDRSYAPWYVIPAEDKNYARIAVLKTVVETLEKSLNVKSYPF